MDPELSPQTSQPASDLAGGASVVTPLSPAGGPGTAAAELRPDGTAATVTADHHAAAGRPLLPAWRRLLMLCLVAAFALCIRYWTLEPMELSGDAVIKWYFSKTWFRGNTYGEWNHHMARMGVMIPAFVAQRIFGFTPAVYSVAPVFMAVVGAVYTFRLGALLAGPIAGVVATVLTVKLPEMTRAGSQLLPDGFIATYVVMAAFYVTTASTTVGRARSTRLILAAFLLFCAYLSNISALTYLPAFVLAVARGTKSWRTLVLFLGVLASFYACEHLAYATLTNYPWGHLQILTGTHHLFAEAEMAIFMHRFEAMTDDWQLFLYPFPVAVAALWALKREERVHWLAWMVVSFLVGLLLSGTRAHTRYLTSTAPLVAIVYGVFLVAVLESDGFEVRSLVRRVLYRAMGFLGKYPELFACVVFGLAAATCLTSSNAGAAVLAEEQAYYDVLNRAYARGIPIVAEELPRRRWAAGRKDFSSLRAVTFAYLRPKHRPRHSLVHIPAIIFEPTLEAPFRQLRVHGKNYVVLVNAKVSNARASKSIERGCAVDVQPGSSYLLMPSYVLPQECGKLAGRKGPH